MKSNTVRLGADETKTDVVVPVVRVVVVAVRRTGVLCRVVPVSVAYNAVSPRRSAHISNYF